VNRGSWAHHELVTHYHPRSTQANKCVDITLRVEDFAADWQLLLSARVVTQVIFIYVAIAMARQMLNARSDLVQAGHVELCA
jgi:hypothetical protein